MNIVRHGHILTIFSSAISTCLMLQIWFPNLRMRFGQVVSFWIIKASICPSMKNIQPEQKQLAWVTVFTIFHNAWTKVHSNQDPRNQQQTSPQLFTPLSASLMLLSHFLYGLKWHASDSWPYVLEIAAIAWPSAHLALIMDQWELLLSLMAFADPQIGTVHQPPSTSSIQEFLHPNSAI